MEAKGIKIYCKTVFDRIAKEPNGRLRAHLSDGAVLEVDQAMLALGRIPNTNGMGLEEAGVELGKAARSSWTIIRAPMCRTSMPWAT